MPQSIKIDNVLAILRSKHFGSGWLQPPEEAEKESFLTNAIHNIVSASTEILKFYILVFLNGDYNFYCDDESADRDLELLTTYIKDVSGTIDDINEEEIKYQLQAKFQPNILAPAEYAHSKLTHFVRDLKIQYSFENKVRLFRVDRPKDNSELDDSVSHYMHALTLLVDLNTFEHFNYTFDEAKLKELIIIERNCRSLMIDHALKEAISVKANFLLKKLLYRKETNDTHSSSPTLIYSFGDQSDEEISLAHVQVSEKLKDWDTLIQVHYGMDTNYKKKQRDRRKEITAKEPPKYLMQDYHGLIKIYKDDSKNYDQAKELYIGFCQRFKQLRTQADIYSRTCTTGYLFNNLISLQCDNLKIDEKEFNRLFESIRNFQNEGNVKNYFPWHKLATRLIQEMNLLTTKLGDPEKYELFLNYFTIYERVLKNIRETCTWSISKSFTPMQLPMDECKSEYSFEVEGYGEQKLFFHTSFILPIDYNEVKKERDGFVSNFDTYSTLKTVYSKLQDMVNTVQDTYNHVRQQERRSVEVIAIFCAVALFSIGSIQIFGIESVQKDPNMPYRFIFTYGHALLGFVIMIWAVTRDNLKKVHNFHWAILFIYGLLTLFLMYTCKIIAS